MLPDDPSAVLRLADIPALAEQIGHDIVTASGTTLLGADNKAGVAEIVTAAAYLVAHPEIPHGPIRIAFTPDEEIGRGTAAFRRRAVRRALRLHDGRRRPRRGRDRELLRRRDDASPFTASTRIPGYAKGRMVNAIKVAADFIDRLPRRPAVAGDDRRPRGLRPPVRRAGRRRADVGAGCSIRDFETAGLHEKEALVEALAREAVARAIPGARVEVAVEESVPQHEGGARPASATSSSTRARRSGAPASRSASAPIRGGTDGSRLSFMGLPTPNLFAGEHNFHSRLEWVSVQDMEKAVEVIVHLAQVWEERT